LDTVGFLYPVIGIANALRQKGHQVALVTDISCLERLSREGLSRIPRGSQDGNSFQVANWAQPLAVAIQVKHIEYALKQFEADVLLGQQLTFGPLLVAERWGLPVALMGFCTYLWPKFPTMQGAPVSESETRRQWRHKDMLNWYNKARALFHMPAFSDDVFPTPLQGDLFMVRSIPELEGDVSNIGSSVRLAGPCLWEEDEEDEELTKWLNHKDRRDWPLIYVQHGRYFHTQNFWSALVQGLARSRVRVVASTSRMDVPTGEIPPNFFTRPHVAQGKILKQAELVIASGTTTAVLGALTYGLPSLLIPEGGEQPDVAERCLKMGVSRAIAPEAASAEHIRYEVNVLLKDRGARQAAVRLAAAFMRVNSFGIVSELLESMLQSGRPRYQAMAMQSA
jgi:UDP:flavonoid glycosyltransferase YjiC (YdhE family)